MKTPSSQVLLYDDNCPLCAVYTKAFVYSGMLEKENRIAFSNVDLQQFHIDIKRARHEIPLVNTVTGDVKYGIDALVEILDTKLCFVKPIVQLKPINWMLKKLYSFISYNRSIIVSPPNIKAACFDCSPDYSLAHRICLAVLAWSLVFMLLFNSPFLLLNGLQTDWFLLMLAVPFCMGFNRSKQAVADIFTQSGLAMLLSTICFLLCLFFFRLLFTSTLLILTISCMVTLLVFMHQIHRRRLFHKRMHMPYNSIQ